MRYYIVLDNGKIDAIVDTNLRYIPVGENVVSSETHYWDDASDSMVERELMALVVDGTRITNIPSTGTVNVTGPLEYSGPVVGEEINLSFGIPGTYSVTLHPDDTRWLPTNVTIEVA